MKTRVSQEKLPFLLFSIYVFFYSAVAVYNTYINLYLSSTGLTNPEIGGIVSAATILTMVTQLGWGIISDRARTKNRVLLLLFLLAASTSLAFYLHTGFVFLAVMVALFSMVFNPITPLQDNLSLELLENTKTDFGQIRMGGTIGYALTSFVIGFLLKDAYRNIFWLTAGFLLICMILGSRLPRVERHTDSQKLTNFRFTSEMRLLLGIVLFNAVYYLGMAFYYNFYPIYYVSVGGDSGMIGMLMFAASLSEIPMLLVVRRLIDRIGVRRLLLIAAGATMLRFVILAFFTHPAAVIGASLLHGPGFTSFSYSVVTFIGKTMPRHLRARGQSMNVLLGTVVPRILAGYIGGVASVAIGTKRVLLVNAGILGLAAMIFWIFGKQESHSEEQVE